MEKIEDIKRTITDHCHKFYCDDCGIFLGMSFEEDDGYYKTFGDFEQKAFIGNRWYKLHAFLCPECAEDRIKKLVSILETNGFELD